MKAQIWSADFVVSAVIFFTVLFLVMFVWNYANIQGAETLQLKDIESKALTVSDALIRAPGLPFDWNETTVRVIGLAAEENVINKTKALRFVNLTYIQSRALLTGRYEFYFELTHVNGTVINESGINLTQGILPLNPSVVVPVERYVLYDDEIKRMKLLVWI